MAKLARLIGVPASSPFISAAASRHVRWVSISCVSRPDRTPLPPRARSPRIPDVACPTTGCSRNWSGHQGSLSKPNSAIADWKVPSSGDPVGITSTYSSTWPGIGQGTGKSTDELIQDGTEQDASCSNILHGTCQGFGHTYYFWFEMFPDESQLEVTNIGVTAGNSVETSATYSYSTHHATFAICNLSKNICGTAVQTSPGPPAGTAEWIMERTTVGGKLPYLADYGTLSVSKAKACDNSNSSCHTISGLGNAFRWTMLTCNQQTIMSETSGLAGGNAFTATWESKGDNDVC